MAYRSLKRRIIILFLSLILGVQFAGFVAIRSSIATNARASINEQLDIGESIFHNLLKENAKTLIQGASILAADYGFRQALASNDGDTIVSALANHRTRINANMAILYDSEASLQGVSADLPAQTLDQRLGPLVRSAQNAGHAEGLAVFDNRAYQVVVVPIKAPLVIGWVVMAFEIDSAFAKELQALSRLEVSFLLRDSTGRWRSAASTFETNTVRGLLAQFNLLGGARIKSMEMDIASDRYSSRVVPLKIDNEVALNVILQRSIDQAIAPYMALQRNLLILTILGALTFIAGSIFTARTITRPLTELSDKAKLLEQGHYDVAINIPQNDEIGRLGSALESMRVGIAERESNIRQLAYWDQLTQLPNRLYFQEKVAANLQDAEEKGGTPPCAILMIDLDRFKHVNDVMGPEFGDQVLLGFAEKLRTACVKKRDTVARLDGDEFGILLTEVDDKGALSIAHRLSQVLEQPLLIQDQKVDLSAGIGIASYPLHASEPEVLISRAETAMRVAKSRNTGAVIYNDEFDIGSQKNLALLSELRTAVEHNQLKLYVQPKIDLRSGQVSGMEGLVRWIHPERGFMSPDTFIPFAEQTGIVRLIGLWVINEAASWVATWRRDGIDLTIAVNLSVRDLIDPELPEKISHIIARHEVHLSNFSFEITESSIMDDPNRALQTVERLHAMGARLSIDDFGTGFSSLAYLKNLPVHELKIDKSFVANMESDMDDSKIVRSTINLGHDLGLEVVAEGIENEHIQSLLIGMGCDYAQGYYISKPMPAADFAPWVKNLKSRAAALQAPQAAS